jgi:ATP synthase protein I
MIMAADDRNRNGMLREVRRRRERRERFRREGERTLAQNLALAGVLGWLVVTPTLAGVLLGRWLDRGHGGGIFWTATLLFVGICLGSWLAWRRIHEE